MRNRMDVRWGIITKEHMYIYDITEAFSLATVATCCTTATAPLLFNEGYSDT